MQVIILQEPREIENGSNTLYKEGESGEYIFHFTPH